MTYKMQPSTSSPSPQHITGKRLLHRSTSHFFILGTTGNVYTVTLTTTPTCTCLHPTTPCKHILYLYTHVLSISSSDPCLLRRTLRPCQLTRLLSAKVSIEAVADAPIRRRFHELYRRRSGSKCPVCLEELVAGGGRVVACATCKNLIHVRCLMLWKSKRSRTCVMCRARWKEMGKEDRYINLSAYVSEDDDLICKKLCKE